MLLLSVFLERNNTVHRCGDLFFGFDKTLSDTMYVIKATKAFKENYLLDFINIENLGEPDEDTDERVIETEIVQHLSILRDEYIINGLSGKYEVRRLSEADITEVLALCEKNTLYYQYCPPFVSEQSIYDDMNALPPGKTVTDKYYVGYYDGERLIAVMDLIMAFPDKTTAFIGFFMTDVDVQSKGLGTSLISELCDTMARIGMKEVRLGWVKGNPQAEHFWKKNGFRETGASNETEEYTVVVAHKEL